MPSEKLLARGGVERIGSDEAPYTLQVGDGEPVNGTGAFPDYAAAIALVEKELVGRVIESFGEIAAFGFKPVMANGISGTQVFDDRVLGAMEDLITLFPAHNPPYINAVRQFQQLYPGTPCIGTFETAFYDDLPAENRRFPIPLSWEKEYGVRRYGFHGASHRFVSERLAEIRGTRELRIISCHLGGSSSLACVSNGTAINSSWGMTPQSGLPQNNRVGDFDVFAALWLADKKGLGVEEVVRALGKDAGLKGMSGLPSGDIRDLKEASAAGNADARISLDVYIASIRKYIGQFLVEMNGADALIFTAGIGENNPDLRADICRDMDFCGLRLDPSANEKAIRTEALISAPDSKIEVHVIPTNEEIIIARNAWAKLS